MAVFASLHSCLLIIGSLLVINVQTHPSSPSHSSRSIGTTAKADHFDILVLTQQWPESICYSFRKKGKPDPCKLLKDNRWVIHGLWPSRVHSANPTYCNKNANFNVVAVSPLAQQLQQTWPSLNHNKASWNFWIHEWQKHGTCGSSLKSMTSEVNYLKKTLELYDKYNMKNLLEKAAIRPGKSYPVQQIVDMVSQKLGKKCVVSYICDPSATTKLSYLSEIQICFDKSFNLIDCTRNIQHPKTCPSTTNVVYPARPRHR